MSATETIEDNQNLTEDYPNENSKSNHEMCSIKKCS